MTAGIGRNAYGPEPAFRAAAINPEQRLILCQDVDRFRPVLEGKSRTYFGRRACGQVCRQGSRI